MQKKWLESMGVPEELVNQILGSGAVQDYQEEQLHSLASRGEGGIGKDYERNRFLSDPGAGRCFRDDCGENCGIDCGDSGDQLFEPHGRSRTWCRACGAVDLDFLCGGVLLSGDTLGECMHEADPGRSGTRMAEGKQSGIAVIEECIVKDEKNGSWWGRFFTWGVGREKRSACGRWMPYEGE